MVLPGTPRNIFYIHPPIFRILHTVRYYFSDKCINQFIFTPFCYSAYYDQQTANIKNNAAVNVLFPILYFFHLFSLKWFFLQQEIIILFCFLRVHGGTGFFRS